MATESRLRQSRLVPPQNIERGGAVWRLQAELDTRARLP